MDAATNWLFVLGPVSIGILACIWWAVVNKDHAIWAESAGAILLLFAAALQVQRYFWISESHARPVVAARRAAYVFLDGTRIANIDGPDAVVAEINMKNFGPITAYDLVHWAGIALLDFPLKVELDSPPPGTLLSRQQGLAPNRQLFKSILFRPLTDQERGALRSGAKALYVFGEIAYKDSDGEGHRTKYLLLVGGSAGFRGEQLAAYPDGNHAD